MAHDVHNRGLSALRHFSAYTEENYPKKFDIFRHCCLRWWSTTRALRWYKYGYILSTHPLNFNRPSLLLIFILRQIYTCDVIRYFVLVVYLYKSSITYPLHCQTDPMPNERQIAARLVQFITCRLNRIFKIRV